MVSPGRPVPVSPASVAPREGFGRSAVLLAAGTQKRPAKYQASLSIEWAAREDSRLPSSGRGEMQKPQPITDRTTAGCPQGQPRAAASPASAPQIIPKAARCRNLQTWPRLTVQAAGGGFTFRQSGGPAHRLPPRASVSPNGLPAQTAPDRAPQARASARQVGWTTPHLIRSAARAGSPQSLFLRFPGLLGRADVVNARHRATEDHPGLALPERPAPPAYMVQGPSTRLSSPAAPALTLREAPPHRS